MLSMPSLKATFTCWYGVLARKSSSGQCSSTTFGVSTPPGAQGAQENSFTFQPSPSTACENRLVNRFDVRTQAGRQETIFTRWSPVLCVTPQLRETRGSARGCALQQKDL